MTTPTPHGAMPELMACPFCGGKAAVVPRAVNIALQKDPSDPKFGVSIICAQCSSETANMVDEAHAAAKWNRRAAIQQAAGAVPKGLIECLRGGKQCDEDGEEIIMSRRACCEAADILEALHASPAIEPPKQQPVKVRELVEELEIAAGRITQYSNSPLDGLLQAAADALRDFAAAPSPRRVQLTADQLYANDELMALNACHGLPMLSIIEIVRTIERAHGIKERS